RIVLEQSERGVAGVAEEPAHLSRRMTMIDAEPARGSSPADRAGAVLLVEHPFHVRRGEAESPAAVRPPALAPPPRWRVAVVGVVGAARGKLALAIFRILAIALPVLLVGESHFPCPSGFFFVQDRSAPPAAGKSLPPRGAGESRTRA